MGASHYAQHNTDDPQNASRVSEGADRPHFCRCGCGGELPPFVDRASRAVRYLPGHFDPRILQNFDIDPESGCWIWRGKPTAAGHGQVRHNGITATAHRFFYNILVGDPGPDITVHHTCLNKLCVNPDHQQEISHAEHRRYHALKQWERQRANPQEHHVGPAHLSVTGESAKAAS